MKSNHLIIITGMILLIFLTKEGLCQITFDISKKLSADSTCYFLSVEVKKDGILLDSLDRKEYRYPQITRLSREFKVAIIEKLFEFVDDTTLCCRPVKNYWNPAYPECYQLNPLSSRFSIRIEALFIINRVAYYNFTRSIGCYPVLFDTETRQEINQDHQLINILVKHYKGWFKRYRQGDEPVNYYYLNKGRIRWWGLHGLEPTTHRREKIPPSSPLINQL